MVVGNPAPDEGVSVTSMNSTTPTNAIPATKSVLIVIALLWILWKWLD